MHTSKFVLLGSSSKRVIFVGAWHTAHETIFVVVVNVVIFSP
jgi:hypothetical protein